MARTKSNRNRRNKIRNYINDAKDKCVICGESEKCCLDFHHIEPSKKSFNIRDLVKRRTSLTVIRNEVEKCCILCSNCHRKVHYNLIDLSEYLDMGQFMGGGQTDGDNTDDSGVPNNDGLSGTHTSPKLYAP